MKNQSRRSFIKATVRGGVGLAILPSILSRSLFAADSLTAFHAQLTPVAVKNVTIEGGFWGPRVETNRTATLWAVYAQLEKSSRETGLKRRQATGDTNSPELLW